MSILLLNPLDKIVRQMIFIAFPSIFFFALPISVARSVDVCIIHASNINAQIKPIAFGRARATGGLGKAYGLISEHRKNRPNLILTSSGTTFFGSPESDVLSGKPIIKALDKLGWNFVAPSGEDFAVGLDILNRAGKDFSGKLLVANVRGLGGRDPLKSIETHAVADVDGVRMAFVGMTASQLPLHYHHSLLDGVEVRDVLESLRQKVGRLRQLDPHIVVLMIDLSFTEPESAIELLENIAEFFPEIDVVLGAGFVRQYAPLEIGGLIYVQSRDRAETLIALDITYDTLSDSITYINVSEVAVEFGEDSQFYADDTISAMLDQSTEMLRKPLAVATEKLPAVCRDNDSSVTALLLQSLRKTTDADVALVSRQNNQVLYPRVIYERDLWRLLPQEEKVVVMRLNLDAIRMILNANLEHSRKKMFLSSLGLCYNVVAGSAGNEYIDDIRMSSGDNIHPRRRLRVAMSSGTVASAGGEFDVIRDLAARPESNALIMDWSTRDALRRYLKSAQTLTPHISDGVIQHLNVDGYK